MPPGSGGKTTPGPGAPLRVVREVASDRGLSRARRRRPATNLDAEDFEKMLAERTAALRKARLRLAFGCLSLGTKLSRIERQRTATQHGASSVVPSHHGHGGAKSSTSARAFDDTLGDECARALERAIHRVIDSTAGERSHRALGLRQPAYVSVAFAPRGSEAAASFRVPHATDLTTRQLTMDACRYFNWTDGDEEGAGGRGDGTVQLVDLHSGEVCKPLRTLAGGERFEVRRPSPPDASAATGRADGA